MVVRLEVKDVNFAYDSVNICDNINFEVNSGEIVSIIGPNGSGKTTILRCITKILKPYVGGTFIDGKNLQKISYKELARLISYVPQNFNISFPFLVLEVLIMGRKPYIRWHPSDEDLRIVKEILELMEMENLAYRYFDELSDGEKQKAMIARALVQKTPVLLLDEPTANLDIKHQLQVLSLIKKTTKENDIAVLMAIHDINLAARFSDKILMLKKGKIAIAGQPDQVLTPHNIKTVYDIDVENVKTSFGEIYIIPVSLA